jgi:hypothetical protein
MYSPAASSVLEAQQVQYRPLVRWNVGLVFLAGFCFKSLLVLQFPALYGGDTVFHLRNYRHLVLGHQMPLLQVLIYLAHRISTHPLFFRFVMITIGSSAGVGFYLLAQSWFGQRTALWAAAFFITNPFLNEISIVPFQEILMVCILVFALYRYSEADYVGAAVLLASACWTRHEAWLVCPVLVFDRWRLEQWSKRALVIATLEFCAGPAIWVLMHFGLSSPGTYAIELPRSAARFVRWIYLAWVCVKQTPLPVLLIAVVGLWLALRDLRQMRRGALDAALFLGLYLVAVLSAAHGIEHAGAANPEMFLSAREATLLVCCALLAAALGVKKLLATPELAPVALILLVLAIPVGALQSAMLVRSQAEAPEALLSYEAARFLNEHVSATDKVAFVARPFTEKDWAYYLEQSKRLQGATGLAAARHLLMQYDLSPMELQRTAIQTTLPQSNLLANVGLGSPEWLVIWSDADVTPALLSTLPNYHPAKRIAKGSSSVAIWRKNGLPESARDKTETPAVQATRGSAQARARK